MEEIGRESSRLSKEEGELEKGKEEKRAVDEGGGRK
jgi:hypothetical protein